MNKTAVRKKQQYVNQNTIEAHRNFGGAIVQHLSDNAKGMASDAWSQLLGPLVPERNTKKQISGDLVEGQEITFKHKINKNHVDSNEKFPALDIVAPGIDYRREILEGHKKIARENVQLIQRQIEDILVEIKKLAHAQKELEVEFREVAVEQRIVNPGKYHVNFLEWLLSIIRLARIKIEDSGAWLSAFQSKKAKRQYWAMFKKHGTTFGLSNERVVATQTG